MTFRDSPRAQMAALIPAGSRAPTAGSRAEGQRPPRRGGRPARDASPGASDTDPEPPAEGFAAHLPVHGFFTTPAPVPSPAPSPAGCGPSCPGRDTFTIWTQKVEHSGDGSAHQPEDEELQHDAEQGVVELFLGVEQTSLCCLFCPTPLAFPPFLTLLNTRIYTEKKKKKTLVFGSFFFCCFLIWRKEEKINCIKIQDCQGATYISGCWA